MTTYDYTSMGFYTFDCLGWPFTEIPPGGGCYPIEELTLAVSGAAGTAAIAAAKMGLKTLAVGGVGEDLMGDWVVQRLRHFGVDTSTMQRKNDWKTSSSIVTTRADGSRPALHMAGATGNFFVTEAMLPKVISAKVFHAGGVGLMHAGRVGACRRRRNPGRWTVDSVIAAASSARWHAVRSAQAIIGAIEQLKRPDGRAFQARIGIATGIVVIGDIVGAGAAREHSIVGDTPNLASRLQALADPNAILIGDNTYRLLARRFDYQNLGDHALKGFATPVRVWRVLREAASESRFAATRAARHGAFIGRGEETALLLDRWRLASQAHEDWSTAGLPAPFDIEILVWLAPGAKHRRRHGAPELT